MTEKEFFSEAGRLTYVGKFSDLKKQVGFRRAVNSLYVRYRYIVLLWLLRELSIYQILIKRYDEIPKRTPSKLIIGLFVRFSFLRALIDKIAAKLQKKLIINT